MLDLTAVLSFSSVLVFLPHATLLPFSLPFLLLPFFLLLLLLLPFFLLFLSSLFLFSSSHPSFLSSFALLHSAFSYVFPLLSSPPLPSSPSPSQALHHPLKLKHHCPSPSIWTQSIEVLLLLLETSLPGVLKQGRHVLNISSRLMTCLRVGRDGEEPLRVGSEGEEPKFILSFHKSLGRRLASLLEGVH